MLDASQTNPSIQIETADVWANPRLLFDLYCSVFSKIASWSADRFSSFQLRQLFHANVSLGGVMQAIYVISNTN
jgi:hypothetical protein